jgi:hypothetical protein
MVAIKEREGEQGMETGAGRTTIRPAISGPLTTAASGLSRSLADTSPRRSGHRQCYRHVHDRTVERHQNCAEARINRTIPAAVSAHRLPGQLNLKLGAVILDLKFHFQMDLIGDVRDDVKGHRVALRLLGLSRAGI